MSSAELNEMIGYSRSSKQTGMEGYSWQLELQHAGAPDQPKKAKKLVDYTQPQRPNEEGFRAQQQMQWGR